MQCRNCKKMTHVRCITNNVYSSNELNLPYYCVQCVADNFPFNHVVDDDEFLMVLNEFFRGLPVFCRFIPNEKHFSILNNTKITNNEDIDPDINAYNSLELTSKYYLPDEISQTLNSATLKNELAVLHVNARSLQNKMDKLLLLINSFDFEFDIITVVETWENEENAKLINLPGFTKISKPRLDGRLGGGLAVFFNDKRDIHYSIRKTAEARTFESLIIDLNKPFENKTVLGIVYRAPDTDLNFFNSEFDALLSTICRKSRLILAGDYNINLLNHLQHPETNNFLNILYGHHVLPTISKPTRITDHSATIIDNILTNTFCNNQLSGIIIDDFSDHFPIFYVNREYAKKIKTTDYIYKNVRQINEENMGIFTSKLQTVDWDTEDTDVNSSYNEFNKKFSSLYNETLPVKTKRVKLYHNQYKPWITHSIITSAKKKNRLYKEYIMKRTPELKIKYSKYRNKLTNIIREAERSYYANRFYSLRNNIKETWNLINDLMKGNSIKKPSISEIMVNDQLLTQPKEIADKFNEYFVNVGPNLAKKIPAMPATASFTDTMPSPNLSSMFIDPVTENEIIRITVGLNNTKGIGLDGFSVKIVKSVITQIATPLCKIFNQSFLTGIFPEELKHARVIPIHKCDDKLLVNNYRPISVLPIFSKILEKLMHKRILAFIDKHKILCENQYGFREEHCTSTAVLDMIDSISQEMDQKNYSIGIFLDLSKAFDTIDHNILLAKLNIYGIRGVALKWIESYLSGRTQCVSIGEDLSSKLSVTCGVPQGSVLGPLLFILYINDIVNASDIMRFVIFADDTNLFLSNPSLTELIYKTNQELILISNWLKLNKLSLNVKKTHYILFHVRQKRIFNSIPVKIDTDTIDQVSFTKFLGVVVNENLTWTNHIDTLMNKVNKNLGVIRKLSSILPCNVLQMLYITLVHPYFNYCNIVWGSQPSCKLDELFRLQKKAVRIINKKKWNDHTVPLFKSTNILKIHDLNRFQVACFVYKCRHNTVPSSFCNFFALNSEVHGHYTRTSSDIHMMQSRINTRHFSLKIYGAIVWNSLSAEVKNSLSINIFKKRLKLAILEQY